MASLKSVQCSTCMLTRQGGYRTKDPHIQKICYGDNPPIATLQLHQGLIQLRSSYTKAESNYMRSGQLEGGILMDYVTGDHHLLY